MWTPAAANAPRAGLGTVCACATLATQSGHRCACNAVAVHKQHLEPHAALETAQSLKRVAVGPELSQVGQRVQAVQCNETVEGKVEEPKACACGERGADAREASVVENQLDDSVARLVCLRIHLLVDSASGNLLEP
eukprot:CAMPEP_0206061800 /NCGR_PEP_ID=MMETSP1466-20131121/55168_1 /ASSEMBLY_ACC=CAM_ASM_001126 /TAXON_ID=44452 /ORGANISM="Pavlova gyrans, Strain CCMP608" /LENGTH=135 /DNA_ID=CAMNT_0053437155 /DNA_START=39 /DNA_END=443 /DNA_ORIENTATION=+